MNFFKEKPFSVNQVISEIINYNALNKSGCIYSFKINLPDEIKIYGKASIFKEAIQILINNANQEYEKNLQFKIILVTCKIENPEEISISVTNGGKGLSFFETKLIEKNLLLFRENDQNLEIYKINKIIKKEFHAYVKIISKKNKGRTVKCFFPLNP